MVGWLILVLAVAAAGLAVTLRVLKDRNERETALVERVRTSALYRQLFPILERCQDACIEQLLIRGEEIRITMYRPMNRVVRFVFAEQGLDAIDQPQTLRALAHAVARDVPCLGDPDKFYFAMKCSQREIGGRDVWYEYNVQPDYKDVMLRAWYDQQEPEEGIIR